MIEEVLKIKGVRKKGENTMDFIDVRLFLHRHEAEMAKNLLSKDGIQAIVFADDCGGHYPYLRVGVRLAVSKGDYEKAQEILKVFDDEIDG